MPKQWMSSPKTTVRRILCTYSRRWTAAKRLVGTNGDSSWATTFCWDTIPMCRKTTLSSTLFTRIQSDRLFSLLVILTLMLVLLVECWELLLVKKVFQKIWPKKCLDLTAWILILLSNKNLCLKFRKNQTINLVTEPENW